MYAKRHLRPYIHVLLFKICPRVSYCHATISKRSKSIRFHYFSKFGTPTLLYKKSVPFQYRIWSTHFLEDHEVLWTWKYFQADTSAEQCTQNVFYDSTSPYYCLTYVYEHPTAMRPYRNLRLHMVLFLIKHGASCFWTINASIFRKNDGTVWTRKFMI